MIFEKCWRWTNTTLTLTLHMSLSVSWLTISFIFAFVAPTQPTLLLTSVSQSNLLQQFSPKGKTCIQVDPSLRIYRLRGVLCSSSFFVLPRATVINSAIFSHPSLNLSPYIPFSPFYPDRLGSTGTLIVNIK